MRTFLRPSGGTRHSRIRASSPAVERGMCLYCRARDYLAVLATLGLDPSLTPGHPGFLPTARRCGSKGSQARSITAVPFCSVGNAVSGRRPGFCSCGRNAHPKAISESGKKARLRKTGAWAPPSNTAPLLGGPSSLPKPACAEPQVPTVRPHKVRA